MKGSMSISAPPASRWPRRLASLALALAAVAAAWSGLWFFAAQQIGSRMDSWMVSQKRAGRVWACPQRRIGGFPFKIELSCDQPGFSVTLGDRVVTGTLKRLLVLAQISAPTELFTTAESPLELDVGESQRHVTLDWASLNLRLHGLASAVPQADLVMTRPAAVLRRDGEPDQTGTAEALALHAEPSPQRPAGDHVVDAWLTISKLAVPALDGLSGSPVPADIATSVTLSQADFPKGLTAAQLLERWRRADGRFEVTSASVVKGKMTLEGSGHVGLDVEHRVEGRLDAKAAGLEPMLARLGVPVAALNVGNALNGLLKLGKGQQPTIASAVTLPLPLKFDNGHVYFGPLKTPVALQPLY